MNLSSYFQFDEEFLSRQEAQAQLIKCEEKVAELQAELQTFRTQVYTRLFVYRSTSRLHLFLLCTHCACFLSCIILSHLFINFGHPKSSTDMRFSFSYSLWDSAPMLGSWMWSGILLSGACSLIWHRGCSAGWLTLSLMRTLTSPPCSPFLILWSQPRKKKKKVLKNNLFWQPSSTSLLGCSNPPNSPESLPHAGTATQLERERMFFFPLLFLFCFKPKDNTV